MRLLLALVVNLFKLAWALLWLPLRLLTAGKRPQYVRYRLSGELPFRKVARRSLRWWRKPDPASVESVEVLRRQLRRLAVDKKVRGVIFEVDGLHLTLAKREALVGLFALLREAGKEVVGYGVTVSNSEYELLCAAQKVVVPAAGRVDLLGYSAELTALGEGLDRLGVSAHFVRRGDYKTAPELFTRKDISAFHRGTVEAILDERYRALVGAVSLGRSLPLEEVKARIDQGPYSARRALAAGLVDALCSEPDLPAYLGTKEKEATVAPYGGYRASLRWPEVSWRKLRAPAQVGVVVINGLIAEGKGGTLPAGPVVAGSVSVISALDRVRKDPRIRAVVLHVTSPGGSAPASEMILEAVKRLAKDKPVIAYFDKVAASGGYMALCGAKEIWGGPGALVGSIGVFAGKFELSGLFRSLGVHRELLTRGNNAGILSSSRGFTPAERAALEQEVEEIYQSFVEVVAQARGRTREEIHQRGEGRVFTSQTALEAGLVDRVGGFEEACRRALELAGVTPKDGIEVALFGAKAPRLGLLGLLRQHAGTHLFALDERWVNLR